MTLFAVPAYPSGAVVVPIPDFRLHSGEPLGPGLKRLALAELERSVTGFYDGEEQFRSAIHESRKATKRVRALLRLVRYEIGEKAYRFENASLRDTARLLSGVRSASVIADGIEELRLTYGPLLADGTFGALSERLALRRDMAERRAMEDPEIVPRVVANLERAHSRYSSWPTDPDSRKVYGVGIRNSFEAIGPGLRETYRRGRSEMVTAFSAPSPARFHMWRKRAKYLRHQFEILTPLWPEVILGMAATLERVADLLGEDHDLAEMLVLVSEHRDLCPNPVERSLLRGLAEQRRTDLETACRILGRRVYAESPKSLESRISAYWESAELSGSAHQAAISF